MASTTHTSVLALPPTLKQNLHHGKIVHDNEEFDIDSLLDLDDFFPDLFLLDSHLNTALSSPPIPNKPVSSAPIIHNESKFVPVAPQPFTLFTTPELLEPSQLSEILATTTTTTTTLPCCVSPSPSMRSLDKPEEVVSGATPASALTKRLLTTAIQPTLSNKKRRVNSCSSSSVLKDSLDEEEKKRRR
jgi:hypothetical protein